MNFGNNGDNNSVTDFIVEGRLRRRPVATNNTSDTSRTSTANTRIRNVEEAADTEVNNDVVESLNPNDNVSRRRDPVSASVNDDNVKSDPSFGCSNTERREIDAKEESGASEAGATAGAVERLECAVCLQDCIHPVRLPCSHIFCYLCIKGVAIRSKRCALCRQDIPVKFFYAPDLLCEEQLIKEASAAISSLSLEEGTHEEEEQRPAAEYQWYYEGVNGWWQYDERSSAEIEAKFQEGRNQVEILIVGSFYVIDFDHMLQIRRNNPALRRRIKRDFVNIANKKGIAGLRLPVAGGKAAQSRSSGDGDEVRGGDALGVAGGGGVGVASSRLGSSTNIVAPVPSPMLHSQNLTTNTVPTNDTAGISATAHATRSATASGAGSAPVPVPRSTVVAPQAPAAIVRSGGNRSVAIGNISRGGASRLGDVRIVDGQETPLLSQAAAGAASGASASAAGSDEEANDDGDASN